MNRIEEIIDELVQMTLDRRAGDDLEADSICQDLLEELEPLINSPAARQKLEEARSWLGRCWKPNQGARPGEIHRFSPEQLKDAARAALTVLKSVAEARR